MIGQERLEQYGLMAYLRPDDIVLDIGCQIAPISRLIAPYCKFVEGIEKEPHYAQTALKLADTDNFSVINIDFMEFQPMHLYDMVIMTRVHSWIQQDGHAFSHIVERVENLITSGGYFLFESHHTETIDQNITAKVKLIEKAGFFVIDYDRYLSHRGFTEHITVDPFKEDIPRKWYMFRKQWW